MSSQFESISEKIKKPFMKKTGKSKKSSEQPGCSKEKEEYERLMMEMEILLQEKYEEVDSLSDEIKKQNMLHEELRGEVEDKVRELSEVEEKANMMQKKLDFVIEEKEEKEMLMNERDLARNKETEELRKEMNSLSVADSSKCPDEILEAFLKMTENLETVREENLKLKKDTKLALNMLQNNAVRLKLMDWNRVRLEQELKTRNQEIDKLRKVLKSMGVLPESEDALYKSFLRLTEELETLRSMKDEMEKLKEEGLRFGSQCAAGDY